MSPKLPTCTCKRCGHEWTPRVNKPVQCPMCRSRIWRESKVPKVREGEKVDGDGQNIPPDEQSMEREVVVVADEIVEKGN